MPILPPFPFRKRKKPVYYRMTCPNCGFDRQYELAKTYAVIRNPDCDHSNDPEIVEELPKVCPKCGAELKKEEIPVMIVY